MTGPSSTRRGPRSPESSTGVGRQHTGAASTSAAPDAYSASGPSGTSSVGVPRRDLRDQALAGDQESCGGACGPQEQAGVAACGPQTEGDTAACGPQTEGDTAACGPQAGTREPEPNAGARAPARERQRARLAVIGDVVSP